MSGYLTRADSIPSVKAFYKKRLSKTLPAYFVWSAVFIVLYRDSNMRSIIVKLLTGQAHAIYYYIFVYVQCVLLTPLLLKIIRKSGTGAKLLLCITPAALVAEYILVLTGHPLVFPDNANNFCVWIAFYVYGLMRRNRTGERKTGRSSFWIWGICMALQIAESLLWYHLGEFDLAASQLKLTSMMTSFAVLNVILYIEPKWKATPSGKPAAIVRRAFRLLGDYSFGIYLMHMISPHTKIIAATQYRAAALLFL